MTKEAICCIRIIQINIRRNQTAFSELREYCIKCKVDMYSRACNKVWQIVSATSISIFYNKDLMAAIIIFNRNFIVTKVSQGTDSHLFIVEFQLNQFLHHQSILPNITIQ